VRSGVGEGRGGEGSGGGGGVGEGFTWVGWIVALHVAQGSKVMTWADYSYNKPFGLTWSLISSKICLNFDVFFPGSCLQRDKTGALSSIRLQLIKGDENPRALCRGSSPQFYMFPCSHGNISFLQNGKEVRNVISKKRVVFVRGGSRTHVFSSWGSRTPLCSHPCVPLLQENALIHKPPLQHLCFKWEVKVRVDKLYQKTTFSIFLFH